MKLEIKYLLSFGIVAIIIEVAFFKLFHNYLEVFSILFGMGDDGPTSNIQHFMTWLTVKGSYIIFFLLFCCLGYFIGWINANDDKF